MTLGKVYEKCCIVHQVVGGDINIVLPCASPKLLSPPIHPLQAPLALIVCVSRCRLARAVQSYDSQQGETIYATL